jgi:arginase
MSSSNSPSSVVKKVALISAKVSNGQKKRGTELAPDLIKTKDFFKHLQRLNYPAIEYVTIEDSIDEEPQGYNIKNCKNLYNIAQTNQKMSDAVSKAIKDGHIPVVLGGDHSLGIGSVHGTLDALKNEGPVGLIWIDAHADINTPYTSDSGNVHGQPVSFVLKEMVEYMPKLKAYEWCTPSLEARNIVYIGLRDVDDEENYILKKFNIKAYSMTDVHRLGIHKVMDEALEYLSNNGQPLPVHVSVDIDSLDPQFAPSTGTSVLGGLTLLELMYIGNRVHESGRLKTLDLVEVNPLLKTCEEDVSKTVFSAIKTILSFFGYNTLGTCDPSFVLSKE